MTRTAKAKSIKRTISHQVRLTEAELLRIDLNISSTKWKTDGKYIKTAATYIREAALRTMVLDKIDSESAAKIIDFGRTLVEWLTNPNYTIADRELFTHILRARTAANDMHLSYNTTKGKRVARGGGTHDSGEKKQPGTVQKRKTQIHVAINDAEAFVIAKQAKKANMGIAKYMKHCACGYNILTANDRLYYGPLLKVVGLIFWWWGDGTGKGRRARHCRGKPQEAMKPKLQELAVALNGVFTGLFGESIDHLQSIIND